MSWREQMNTEAVRLAWGDAPPEHDEVQLEVDFDDGYDPTYGGGDPRFAIGITLLLNGCVVAVVNYTDADSIDRFLKALLGGAA